MWPICNLKVFHIDSSEIGFDDKLLVVKLKMYILLSREIRAGFKPIWPMSILHV